MPMSNDTHLIVVAGGDGKVVAQNNSARQKLGAGIGKYCWDVMGSLSNAESLPCSHGCALKLLGNNLNSTQNVRIKQDGKHRQLTCIPSNGEVVCLLTSTMDQSAYISQTLSPREREILRLLAKGETSSTTAELLGVSESTIRTHIERIRGKLCVNTRAAAVAEGFRLGYLD